MRSSPVFFSLLLAVFVSVALPVLATPPAAPSNFAVFLTKFSQSASFPHTYVFLWDDNSSTEDGFELDYRFGTSGAFSALTGPGSIAANTTGTLLNLQSIADGTTIQFVVRSYIGSPTPTEYSAASNIFTITIPATKFLPPTGVAGTPVSESVINVKWNDVSTSEDGVELWMAEQPGGTFAKLGDILFYQSQQINMTGLFPGVGYQFKLRAYREGATQGAARTYTAFSATSATDLPGPPTAPTGLTASNVAPTSLTLSWTDNSSTETSYEVLSRPTGAGAFNVHQYVAANATTVAVTNLTPGVSLDFAVRARADYVAPSLSAISNVVTKLMHDVIDSPHYAQGIVGQPFSYALTTTTGSPVVTRNIIGLPPELSFDSNTGLVTGTPTTPGVTQVFMSATFADGSSYTPGLSVRILNPPVVASVIPPQTVTTGTPVTVLLGGAFTDPEETSAVKVTTTLGTMHFILFDSATPQTVANFMNYVNSGRYVNTVIDRSVPGFLVQGGSFKVGAPPNNFSRVPKFPAVVNEPGISSTRGTISMAKQDGDPNSATNEFFVNLENNGPILDTQNGGFTVFGRVAGTGMNVADAMARKPAATYTVVVDGTAGSSPDWPLDSPDALPVMDNTKIVGITNIAPESVFSYDITSNTNAGAVAAAVSGSGLTLTPVAPGTANITVRATNLDGYSVSQTFAVTASSNVATLLNLVSSSGALNPAFSGATTGYAATVPNTTSSLTLTPTATQAQSAVKINNVPVASGAASSAIALTVGSNVITVFVTAEDGVTTKTYTLTVTRTAAAPTVTTLAAGGVNATGVTLNGTVDAKGASTATSFDYGTTTAYGGNIAATSSPVTGTGATAVSAGLGGLTAGTTYHFRARGTNAAGTALGADMTITTLNSVATLSNLILSPGTLSPSFSSATTAYSVIVPNGTASLTVTPTVSQAKATVQVNGSGVPSGKASGAITLAPGPNTVTVLVTAQDGLTSKNYTLAVTRALPPVATTLAATGIGATVAKFNGTVNGGGASTTVTFDYGTTTAYGSSVAGTPSSVTGASNTAVSANLPALLPSTTYHFRVKAVSVAGTVTGTDATFATPSNLATLSGLALSTGALSPVFASATTSYTQSVSNATASLTVTPTLANALATVRVNGAAVASGVAGGGMALSPGLNTITVLVTAQDGAATKTYTVAVTRLSAPAVVTLTATNVTAVGAKLNGTINALNTSTTASFAHGLTTAYGSSVAATPSPVAGSAVTAVSATLAGLQPGTTYHFQVKGVNAGGTSPGADVTFTTPGNVATLSNLGLSAGTLSPVFSSVKTAYTATVPNTTDTLTVTPTLSSDFATVTVNGNPVASGGASNAINLSAGTNAIAVVGTAQDGTTTKTYTVTVTRTAALASVTTAAATGVTATGATLNGTINAKSASTSATFNYGLTLAYGSSVVATPSSVTGSSATAVSATPGGLAPGSTYHYRLKGVNLAGTALGGDATFNTPSNVATLSGLVLSSGALSPAFTSATTTYVQTVPVATALLTVKPTATHSAATLLLNGAVISSGTTSGAIALNPGPNAITVTVTAQDGVATRNYSITVTRAILPATTTLVASNLKTNGAKLNATVNAGGLSTASSFEYGLTASYGIVATATPASVTGAADTAVSATLSGLPAGTTYHYRVKGTNFGGTSTGLDSTFTTQTANLASLALGSLTLTPAFSSGTTAYSVSVPFATSSLTLTPTVTDSATVKVNGIAVVSGSPSLPVPIAVGANIISTVLTSQDGIATKTYTVTVVRAAPVGGSLDSSFNGSGKTTTSIGGTQFSGGNDLASGVAVQTDGKIVVAGTANDNGLQVFALTRYNPDGSLDTSFNGTGKLTTAMNGNSFAYGLAIQGDGKIVVVGESEGSVALARYNANGSLDTTFNSTGKLVVSDTGRVSGRGVAIQGDGKMVVAVQWSDVSNIHWLGLLRCNSDGALDIAFGGTGTGQVRIPTSLSNGFDSFARAVALQADGKIILAGYGSVQFQSGNTNDMEVARFNANGTWDLTFGGGVVSADLGSTDDRAYGVAVQSDGKVVVAGSSGGNFALVRYKTDGTPDTTFNTTGRITTDFGGGDDLAGGIALQADGKIVLAGQTNNGGNYDFALARYTAAGVLDTSFNGTGKVTTPFGTGSDFGAGVAVQIDGKIVVAGSTNNGADFDFAVARYQPDTLFSVATTVASAVSATGATINGLVAPGGYNVTTSFDYGKTAAYGSNAAASPATVTGSTAASVSKVLTGLTPGTTYHYRAKGINPAGTVTGVDATFTTPTTVATLSGLALSTGTLSPVFSSATIAYTVAVPNATASLTVTPTVTSVGATMKVNGSAVASGTASAGIGLSAGGNVISIVVTAQDGTTTKTYTVTVNRAALAPVMTTVAATVVDATSATLNGTANASNAATTVSFDYGLTAGYGSNAVAAPSPVNGASVTAVSKLVTGLAPATTYHFRVKGVNSAGTTMGTDATFTTPSNVATLSGLALNGATLSPAFFSATTSYASTVSAATASITVTPAPGNANAIMRVNSVIVPSGTASAPIPLAPGLNPVIVQVTAQDGVTAKTYTVNVTRLASPTATTLPATNSTAVGARLNGTIDAINTSTTASFSFGLTAAYGSSATATPSPVTGTGAAVVSATIAGLQPGTTYHFQVKGVSAGGTGLGGDATFTTPGNVATLAGLGMSAGTLSPAFSSATTAYSATVGNGIASLTVTPTMSNGTATVKVNGVSVTPGSASGPVSLNVGVNSISVVGTAQDGTTTKTYTLAVTRSALAPTMITLAAASVNGTGATLNGTANANNASTAVTFDYGFTVAYGSSAVAAPASLAGNAATPVSAVLSGLLPGSTYHYRVRGVSLGGTALGGDAAFTTPGNVATLSSLVPSTGSLSPVFAGATTVYTQTVSNATASLTITPTATSGAATLLLNGVAIASGSTSGAIPMSPGLNVITVQVTAQDGVTTVIYTMNVTRTTPAPMVATEPAGNVGATFATAHGTVNPQGTSASVTFDYGLTTAYGSSAAAAESPLSGSSVTPVTGLLAGLLPGSTYHYRISALNAGGLSSGLDATFTTPSNVTTLSNLVLSTGALNPAFTSATTSYSHTVPNETTSLTVTPTVTSAAATLLVNGLAVPSGGTSGAIALVPGPNTLTVQVTAEDGVTTRSYTVFVTRTTPAPTVVTQAADNVSTTGATLHGTVNAEGTSTNASFDYGLTTAYGSSTAAAESPVTGTSVTPVSAQLTGLVAGTAYHYRVSAQNVGGPGQGLDGTFTTTHLPVLGGLTPASTSSDSTTPVVLHATGLVTGESVIIERFVDANANGTIDPGEFLAERFTITDGQVTSIAGVRNTNVPGDEDGAADGQVSVNLTPALGAELGRLAGAQIIRVSSPTSAFVATTTVLTVTQPAQAQSIAGTVTDGTNPVPYASVVLLDSANDGAFALGVVANAAGQFTIQAPVGSYEIFAVNPGYVATFDPVALGAGDALVRDPLLVTAASSISGKVADAGTSAGLGGVQLFAQSQGGQATIASSNGDGTYSMPVTAGQWQIEASPVSLRRLGYLSLSDESDGAVDTTASAKTGINLNRPKVTALIHGTVADGGASPLAGILLGARDSNRTYISDASTDSNGHYVLGATAGSWEAFISGNSPGLAGLVVPESQAVSIVGAEAKQADFTLLSATTEINGSVLDSGNQPIGGVHLTGSATAGGIVYLVTAITDASGNYSLPVFAGAWTVNVSNDDLQAEGYFSPPDQDAPVNLDPVTVNFIAPQAAAAIAGSVKDSQTNPISGVPVFVSTTLTGIDYSSSAVTDANGNYSIPVFAGAWNVSVVSDALQTRGYLPPSDQSPVVGTGTATIDFVVIHATATIAGSVKDAQNNSIVGVKVVGSAIVGGIEYSSRATTAAGGNYSLPVFAGTWNVSVSGDDLQALGFLTPPLQGASVTTGTVALNFIAPHATAAIHGTVTTPPNTAVPFIKVVAREIGGQGLQTSALADAGGNYYLGVTTGSWDIGGESGSYIAERQNVIVNTNGSDVLQNLVVHPVTAHLRGQVRDNHNNPVGNLAILAHDFNLINTNVFAATDAGGNFDLAVYGGGVGGAKKQWTLQVLVGDTPALFVSSNASFSVQDGVDINGITYLVYVVTAHLRGQVLDENDQPVGDVAAYASSQTVAASSGGNVDATGHFDLAVFGDVWGIGLSNYLGLGLVPENLFVSVPDNVDQENLVLHVRHATATIGGVVRDAQDIPVAGVHVTGSATLGGIAYLTSVITDAGGNYALPVFSETWGVDVSAGDLQAQGYQAPSTQFVFVSAGTIVLNFGTGLSSDAGLANLVLGSGTLSPAFASATTSYTASVSNATTAITVTPTLNNGGATVKVNEVSVGSGTASALISLSEGDNEITVLGTAQDGVTEITYTVTVTRLGPGPAIAPSGGPAPSGGSTSNDESSGTNPNTQPVPIKARLAGPTINGGVLPGASVTFAWDAGRGVSEYWLSIGTTVDGADLYDSGQGTAQTRTVSLPTDGHEVYVTLNSRINGSWLANKYLFVAADTSTKAVLIAPADQSKLDTTDATFTWNEIGGADEYWLSIGTIAAGTDIYDGSQGTASSRTVTLPADGRELFVMLKTRLNDVWALSSATLFASGSGAPSAAQMTSPANHSALAGGSITFTWDAGSGVSEYWLSVGTSAIAIDAFSASQGTNHSVTLALPADGGPLYVTLSSLSNGSWQSNLYLYDAAVPK